MAGMRIGLNEVEAFCAGLNCKFRSKAFQEKGTTASRGVVVEIMRTKISDEVRKLDEFTRERDKVRREIKNIYGQKSVTTKAIIKNLQISAQKIRTEFRTKYDTKKLHLMKKHKAKKKTMACAPANIGEYARAAVYDRESFDDMKEDEITISKVGKVEVSEDENEA